MNVYEKLQAARIQLQTAPLKKTGHNKFAGYYYFELGDFLPTVQVIFSELKLCGIVSYTADTAFLEIVDMEDTSGKIVITSPMGSAALKGCHEVQNIGAVETYQRRYLWVTAMEIVEHDVLDATTKKDAPKLLHSATSGLWESMSEDSQTYLQKIANEVTSIIVDGDMKGAYDHLHKDSLDTEEKAALWSRFDSKIRSALTKEANSRKAAA